jgi:hypothetical protein
MSALTFELALTEPTDFTLLAAFNKAQACIATFRAQVSLDFASIDAVCARSGSRSRYRCLSHRSVSNLS